MGEDMDIGEAILYIDGKFIRKIGSGCAQINLKDKEKSTYATGNTKYIDGISVSFKCKINNLSILQLMGLEFKTSELMINKIQRKKHNQKRINKKWAKKYGFIQKPKNEVYVVGNYILGHPVTIDKLKKSLGKN